MKRRPIIDLLPAAAFLLCTAGADAASGRPPSAMVVAQTAPQPKAAPARRVLLVGPTREIKAPSAAARVAANGDHIRIDAGAYTDCAVWTQSDLFLQGVGERPHLRDTICREQAIWLFSGNRIRIDNIEFSGARHPIEKNAAGVKMVGNNLIVQNSSFHHNDNGILTAQRPDSTLRIDRSEFRHNGNHPPGAHGIYAGLSSQLIVTNSVFQYQEKGHHIKSRARITQIVGNRLEDGLEGKASFAIDIPNGGTVVIRNNYIQKGPQAENRMTMISIGAEGATNQSRGIHVLANSFLNSHPKLDSFVWNRTEIRALVQGNRFLGSKGLQLKGPGQVLP